ncbi:MAG: DMT family protein [Succinivibrionaceae bacterium]
MGAWGVWVSLAMLIVSNVFMTFAWFGHLRYDNDGFILLTSQKIPTQ